METDNLEQVKELINIIDDYSREEPPSEEQVQQMQYLTGVDWTAEELEQHCFEYTSRASLEETAYLMFHKKYPPTYEVDLVFWKCQPNTSEDDKTVYETYCFGRGTVPTLEPLPLEKILKSIGEMFPKWKRNTDTERDGQGWRFECLEQAEYWTDTHFWIFEYGRETEVQREHQLLRFSCHNMNDEQINIILKCMASFQCPLHIREEHRIDFNLQ